MSKTIDTDSLFELEWGIVGDKLAQGVEGLEWLVLNKVVTQTDLDGLKMWLKRVQVMDKLNVDIVMMDAFMKDSDVFYDTYGINWWISVDDSLTYLSELRDKDYDTYFKFMQDYKYKLSNKGDRNIE
jgi:hypothetical protein